MRHHILASTLAAIGLTAAPAGAQQPQDPFATVYKESCSACHGENMEGATQGPALAGGALRHGDSIEQITKSIATGFPDAGMPSFSRTLDALKLQRLAIFIGEKRANLAYTDFKVAAAAVSPEGVVKSKEHSFRIETVASGLDRLPYSIAPLPDGRMLVTEKTRGLRIIAKDGTVSDLVKGTPQAFDDGFEVPGIKLVYGMGYLMDVAPHPDYGKNGWIYLHYTERCGDCNEAARKSKRPVSGNVVVRARIKNGEWVDQQPIWRTPIEQYTGIPDMAAGGRLAFDGNGHVFLSVGIKSAEYAGIQDLSLPYGKIHRVNDDGTIPADNPFVGVANAMPSIWTYGHRSPEGLEFDRRTGRLWETEMGQRGGDEVNLLRKGGNYGWPLRSKGLKYDGSPVDYGTLLGIEPDVKKMQEPMVDFTPSPALSSFVVYDGKAFPRWRGHLLVGSLKATELYRVVPSGDGATRVETLLKGLGRIRDVATGADGTVFVLLEHASGGRVVKLIPAS
jgi:aldose sugar dehydrogenase